VNGVVERFRQVAREFCLRLLVVFDRLASIEPGDPDIFQLFRSRALEVARLERQHCFLHDLFVHLTSFVRGAVGMISSARYRSASPRRLNGGMSGRIMLSNHALILGCEFSH
jgi:hypothetical protein